MWACNVGRGWVWGVDECGELMGVDGCSVWMVDRCGCGLV